MMFCTKCGNALPQGTAFCGKCGAPVSADIQQNRPAPRPPTPKSTAPRPTASKSTARTVITVCVLVIAMAIAGAFFVTGGNMFGDNPIAVPSPDVPTSDFSDSGDSSAIAPVPEFEFSNDIDLEDYNDGESEIYQVNLWEGVERLRHSETLRRGDEQVMRLSSGVFPGAILENSHVHPAMLERHPNSPQLWDAIIPHYDSHTLVIPFIFTVRNARDSDGAPIDVQVTSSHSQTGGGWGQVGVQLISPGTREWHDLTTRPIANTGFRGITSSLDDGRDFFGYMTLNLQYGTAASDFGTSQITFMVLLPDRGTMSYLRIMLRLVDYGDTMALVPLSEIQ